MKLEQLRGLWESWKAEPLPEFAFRVLADVGCIRRAGGEGLAKSHMSEVRELEVRLRKDAARVIGGFSKFLADSEMLGMAREFSERPEDEDLALSFYRSRDDAELAWHLALEYAEDECPEKSRMLGDARRMLDEVDDIVLFRPNAVANLRKIGNSERTALFDPDFFWWLPADRGPCHLPTHRRDEWMAGWADGALAAEDAERWKAHLAICADCAERMK